MNSFKNTNYSIAALALRLVIGFVFAAHGWQKFNDFTMAGTTQSFEQMGVPAAQLAAPLAAGVELVGGLLLIAGLLTRVAAALLVLDMLGAFVLVHLAAGVFVDQGGFELVAALGAGALVLAVAGPGDYSVDRLIFSRRSARVAVAAR